eukprot:scaffold207249_cov22-Tisochrysis_lutea.AAC.4
MARLLQSAWCVVSKQHPSSKPSVVASSGPLASNSKWDGESTSNAERTSGATCMGGGEVAIMVGLLALHSESASSGVGAPNALACPVSAAPLARTAVDRARTRAMSPPSPVVPLAICTVATGWPLERRREAPRGLAMAQLAATSVSESGEDLAFLDVICSKDAAALALGRRMRLERPYACNGSESSASGNGSTGVGDEIVTPPPTARNGDSDGLGDGVPSQLGSRSAEASPTVGETGGVGGERAPPKSVVVGAAWTERYRPPRRPVYQARVVAVAAQLLSA